MLNAHRTSGLTRQEAAREILQSLGCATDAGGRAIENVPIEEMGQLDIRKVAVAGGIHCIPRRRPV